MLVTDILMVLALATFTIVWFKKELPLRGPLLWVTAVAGALFGGVSVFDARPQAAVGVVVATVMVLVLLVRKLRGNRSLPKTPVVSGVLFLLLAVGAYLPIYWFPITDLPAPTGEHLVGVRTFELTDESRTGVLGAPSDEARRLLVKVWYPAESIDGLDAAPYLTSQEAKAVDKTLGFGLPLYDHTTHVRTNSYQEAPLLANAQQLPVVFFSHGYTSFVGQNTVMMEELASCGYLVFSIQHVYDSVDTIFPNGDVIPTYGKIFEALSALSDEDYSKMYVSETMGGRRDWTVKNFEKFIKADARIYTESVAVWIDDRLFVKDALEKQAVDSNIIDIAAAGNYQAVGHAGMSFGGSTAGAVCHFDPDCAAAVNMDGGNFESSLFNTNIRVPFMMFMNDWPVMFSQLGGEGKWDYSTFGFNDFSYERHAEAGLRDDFYRLRVKDIQHLGVSDFTLFTRGIVRKAIFGDVDGDKMVGIINDFVAGFFDKYLRGVDGDPVKTAFAKHSDQVVEHKATAVSEWWNSLSAEEQKTLEANRPASVITLPLPGAKKSVKNPQATITFESGKTIELELYPEAAPQSVRNFIHLANQGFFDDGPIWRVEKGSLIQGGAQQSDGSDGPGYAIKGEFTSNGVDNPIKFTAGTIGYGRLTPNDGGSAYYIVVSDMPRLDGNYAAFGRVTNGLDWAKQISELEAEPIAEGLPVHRAINPVMVSSVRVETFGVEYPEPEKLPLPTPEEVKEEWERITQKMQQAKK